MFKAEDKVLIVAAHPDDEVLGCGGIMAHFIPKGVKFYVYVTNIFRTPQGAFDRRKRALLTVADFLGFEFLGLGPFAHLHMNGQIDGLASQIGEFVVDVKPNWVFSHWLDDMNQDHVACAHAVNIAMRPGFWSWSSWAAMEVASSTESGIGISFDPNLYIEIKKKDVEKKIAALELYDEEVQSPTLLRSSRGIRTIAAYRGMQIRKKYAEAFMIKRMIG